MDASEKMSRGGHSHLLEIVLSELVRDAKQLSAGVRVRKGPDPQTVGRVQLPLEELAAGFLDLSELEQAGGGKQSLNIALLDRHLQVEGGASESTSDFFSPKPLTHQTRTSPSRRSCL